MELASRRRAFRLAIALASTVSFLSSVPIRAQEAPTASAPEAVAPEPTSSEEIEARRTALLAELAALDGEIAAARAGERQALEELREDLIAVRGLLDEQESLAAEEESEAPGDAMELDDEDSPFALFELLERRRIEIRAGEDRDAAIGRRREALAAAKEAFEEAERARRTARAALAEAAPARRAEAASTLRAREAASRRAKEQRNVQTLRLRALEHGGPGATSERLEERIEALRARLARGEGDSATNLNALTQREGEVARRRESLERNLETVELRLRAAQDRFAKQTQPSSASLAEVETLTARRDAIRQRIALASDRLERLGEQRSVWKRWEAVLRKRAERDELPLWEEEASARIETLERVGLQREDRAADLTSRIAALERRIEGLAAGDALRPVLEEQLEGLKSLREAVRADVEALATDRRLTESLLADLRDARGYLDLAGQLDRARRTVAQVWGYEITAVDDQPITVGSVVLALLFFGAGLWFSRRGAESVGRVAEERFGIDPGAAHALHTISFYVLLIGFTLMALRAVHFPLTAFTVLGGALAIGVGFGSQNVMNNFISGLILMLERPVRARDVVEVDGNHGTIERIGARSTQIRSTDGRHIVVPNSFFLESNVVNWTLSDDLVRTSVLVGVVYGSPTRLVEQLIQRVVDEDENVLKRPAPIIVFDEFGDNSLNFEVHFWVRARSPMAMKTVQSGIRFRIDDLFREHDLVIAFPQRDVHLDSVSPIEVRMVSKNPEE